MTHAGHDLMMIHAFADDALDAVHAAAVETRLAACADCAAEHARLMGLRAALRGPGVRQVAPASLRDRLGDSLARAAGLATVVPLRAAARSRPWTWMSAGAGVAMAACAAMFAVSLRVGADDALTRDLVASHVRSLQVLHLTDVETSDQHVVKPWFNGKLDFAPPVVELKDQGFPLVGGRLDYLGRRAVAAIVYRRGGHIINLFVWPSRGAVGERETRPGDGYDLRRWGRGGMTYWAVSDVNPADLARFEAAIKARAGG